MGVEAGVPDEGGVDVLGGAFGVLVGVGGIESGGAMMTSSKKKKSPAAPDLSNEKRKRASETVEVKPLVVKVTVKTCQSVVRLSGMLRP